MDDSHLIIDKAYLFGAKSLNIIPMSADTYLSFQISKLHFKVSMNLLHTSLDNVVNNLKNSEYDFPGLKKHCKYIIHDTDLDLFTKKGTYPYEYLDCADKFNDTELPES